MMVKHVFVVASITAVLVGCSVSTPSSEPEARRVPVRFKGKSIQSHAFSKARIAVGLTKANVLAHIALSRAQYEPLESDTDSQLYVSQPSDETIRSNNWFLTCPSRNAHVLGGGGGIMLRFTFTNGKVSAIKQFPWLGA
jgi:hypothetical protein